MFGYPQANFFPTSVTTNVDITLDVNGMTYGDTSQGGFSGEDFSDATSSRFDGGDSAFAENVGKNEHDQTTGTISPSRPSVDSHGEREESESDISSQICQVKEVTI